MKKKNIKIKFKKITIPTFRYNPKKTLALKDLIFNRRDNEGFLLPFIDREPICSKSRLHKKEDKEIFKNIIKKAKKKSIRKKKKVVKKV